MSLNNNNKITKLDAQKIQELAQALFKVLESELQIEFKDMWNVYKDRVKSWCEIVAKLKVQMLIGDTSLELKKTHDYAMSALDCLRVEIKYSIEQKTGELIAKLLRLVLATVFQVA